MILELVVNHDRRSDLGDDFSVKIPGVSLEDLDLDVKGRVVTIQAGLTRKSFDLPPGVNGDHVEATFVNEILAIHFPRA